MLWHMAFKLWAFKAQPVLLQLHCPLLLPHPLAPPLGCSCSLSLGPLAFDFAATLFLMPRSLTNVSSKFSSGLTPPGSLLWAPGLMRAFLSPGSYLRQGPRYGTAVGSFQQMVLLGTVAALLTSVSPKPHTVPSTQ